ncbi:MAG: hypothetical protein ABIB71_08860 [Candidatus Woesearchaeota archaeon]
MYITEAIRTEENSGLVRVLHKRAQDDFEEAKDGVLFDDASIKKVEDFEDFLEMVAADVDKFLGIKEARRPRIKVEKTRKVAGYSWEQHCILHTGDRRESAASILAHEYVHSLQYGEKWKFPALFEGMARGVEKHIANLWAEDKDSMRYAFDTRRLVLQDLTGCYERLLDIEEELHPSTEENLWNYEYGTAALLIAEYKRGEDVYKEIYHDPWPYGKLIDILLE